MSDPFLEREKELKKLNESLNNKMTFDLKQPKTVNLKPINKVKKVSINKAFKSDANQAKNRLKETMNKLKNDNNINNNNNNGNSSGSSSNAINIGDVKKPFSNTYMITEKCGEKHELDPKDASIVLNSKPFIDDTHKITANQIKSSDDEQMNTNKIGQTLIETIEKAIDTKSTTNPAHFSLIPSTICRKNISTEGIIKYVLMNRCHIIIHIAA